MCSLGVYAIRNLLIMLSNTFLIGANLSVDFADSL